MGYLVFLLLFWIFTTDRAGAKNLWPDARTATTAGKDIRAPSGEKQNFAGQGDVLTIFWRAPVPLGDAFDD